jgi:subtilisin family serine protease
MAAPFVTGVAGLVQEAFPYMSGKEIADTLLSTANNNIVLNQGYFVTR